MRVQRFLVSAAVSCAVAFTAYAQGPETPPSPLRTLRPVKDFVTVTDQTIRAPKAADWVSYRGNYQGWGYSALDQISTRNVRNLQLVWSRAMQPGINQATPLVYNGVMYLGNPGDVIQAIDAAIGDLMWEYRHPLPPLTSFPSTIGQRKRSIALYGDKVYTVTWDNHVLALDARTGAKVWETDRGGDFFVTNASGPIVANGVVVAGSSCQHAGHGCYVTGHDAATGRELWRNTMIPRPGEPGDETWAGSPYETRWMTGVWGHLTYDPELELVYYGSSAVGPASEAQRKMPGATMAGTNTRFAVRPKTGEVVWKHQVLPRDNWDQECTFEMMTMTTQSPRTRRSCCRSILPRAASRARRSPACPARPALRGASMPRPVSSCGRAPRTSRTSSRRSTARDSSP
jgi:alcohol dehydrogenase (cytochrome c)